MSEKLFVYIICFIILIIIFFFIDFIKGIEKYDSAIILEKVYENSKNGVITSINTDLKPSFGVYSSSAKYIYFIKIYSDNSIEELDLNKNDYFKFNKDQEIKIMYTEGYWTKKKYFIEIIDK